MDELENDNFLEKSSKKADRMKNSRKARSKRANNQRKRDKQHEEQYMGNYE